MYREVNEMARCATCGILVPTAEVHFQHHGRDLIACSSKCVALYDSYRYPRHKAMIEAQESQGRMTLAGGYAPGRS